MTVLPLQVSEDQAGSHPPSPQGGTVADPQSVNSAPVDWKKSHKDLTAAIGHKAVWYKRDSHALGERQ